MKLSFKILTIAGIGIYVHVLFLLLVAYFFSVYFLQWGVVHAIQGSALIISIFSCILLHELGHALAAKRFGVKTKSITLLPIGGVAKLERIPQDPKQEFLIAIAGPLVNVAIALLLLLALWVGTEPGKVSLWSDMEDFTRPRTGLSVFLLQLLQVNTMLVIFNMIPAFPMDGGRILRSLIACFVDYTKATRLAATVGQIFAVLFVLYGILQPNAFLVLIAVFVFLGAAGEAAHVQMQAAFRGLPTSSGMMTEFKTLGPDDTLGHAVDLLLRGNQVDFPVVEDGEVLGLLTRHQLVDSLRKGGLDTPVKNVPLKKVTPVEARAPLFRTWEMMTKQGVSCLPVVDRGHLSGWITSDNIAEVAMVREALAGHDPQSSASLVASRSDQEPIVPQLRQ